MILDNHEKISKMKMMEPGNLIKRIGEQLHQLLRGLFDYTQHTELIDEQDHYIVAIRARMKVLRDCVRKVGGNQQVMEFDAILERDRKERRQYFLLQQEWMRNRNPDEDGYCFDFVNI